MKPYILSLICIIVISACGQAVHKKTDNTIDVTDTTVKSKQVLPAIDPSDSLKIKYVPEKYKTDLKTRQQQKIWMKKWETAVKENNQKEVIEALEKAARYNSGEACYKLGEIYKSGKDAKKDQVKSDSLFYYSAVYGYKPAIEWLNSGEGVFMPGGEISMPEFPGGEDSLTNYVNDKVRRVFINPDDITISQGKVIVMFIIEKDGSIRYAKVIQNTIPTYMFLERVIPPIFKNMPKWEPAVWEGQLIRCFFTCPVLIRMGM